VITVIAGAGCVAIYAALERALQRAVRERQRDMERQLNAMATTMKALQARVAELSRLQAARVQEGEVVAISAAAENASEGQAAPVKPEIVAVLTAAATAFLGKKARVRSAQLLPNAPENAGAWAQQGRVIVQTSHNMRPTR
jgi:hypothetical protein